MSKVGVEYAGGAQTTGRQAPTVVVAEEALKAMVIWEETARVAVAAFWEVSPLAREGHAPDTTVNVRTNGQPSRDWKRSSRMTGIRTMEVCKLSPRDGAVCTPSNR